MHHTDGNWSLCRTEADNNVFGLAAAYLATQLPALTDFQAKQEGVQRIKEIFLPVFATQNVRKYMKPPLVRWCLVII